MDKTKRESHTEYMKQWRAQHQEWLKEYQRSPEYREKRRLYMRKYRKQNGQKQYGDGDIISYSSYRQLFFEAFGVFKCQQCGSTDDLQVHHEHGKKIELANIKILCPICHRKSYELTELEK
jgi:5-methylcytosine-specific restriction endonuclease McrA